MEAICQLNFLTTLTPGKQTYPLGGHQSQPGCGDDGTSMHICRKSNSDPSVPQSVARSLYWLSNADF
jgi:hypothetical protein